MVCVWLCGFACVFVVLCLIRCGQCVVLWFCVLFGVSVCVVLCFVRCGLRVRCDPCVWGPFGSPDYGSRPEGSEAIVA